MIPHKFCGWFRAGNHNNEQGRGEGRKVSEYGGGGVQEE